MTTTATAQFGRRATGRGRNWILRMARVSLRRARRNAAASRSRRIVLLLALLWVCSSFDLLFTLMAQRLGNFQELNPVANAMLHSPAALIIYKLAMLFIGSYILFRVRRHWFAEVACWGISVVYTALSFIWLDYYMVASQISL